MTAEEPITLTHEDRRAVNAISGRLSLRVPQREALEILARVTEILALDKRADVGEALGVVRSEFPKVTDFERDFPSLCFHLATGVGKTRLMGAFATYLFRTHGIRHFFVLAPSLTIYNKLIADFTPGTPKYVFQGIAEFAQEPPEVVTGDNYESGRGVRRNNLFGEIGVNINIFNISKINAETRGGKSPRIKRLSEYIGESYFDYLAGLDDLVLMMDESHRYRGTEGARAINELKPVLGLELTATPQVETARGAVPFKNVIYSYPLANALADGFVKDPAVATRENFRASDYTTEQLERLKIEDGIRVHEDTKVELDVYSQQNDVKRVKPFLMIVAQDTDHANALLAMIKSEEFFGGRYKDRVITVHSNQRGEEKEETVQQLLSVEDPDNKTEIVIHVNMLKEGWDVTNLYTIVPLRAANSRTLVEQSIGRGLRLPYGKRVGVSAVDRLTIVAHDRFQDIIDDANKPDSVIRQGVVIGRDIAVREKQTVTVQPLIVRATMGIPAPDANGAAPVFATAASREVASATMQVIKRFERLPRAASLAEPGVLNEVVREVRAMLTPVQLSLEGTVPETQREEIEATVVKTIELFINQSIDIPRIIVVPTGQVTAGFDDFDLDVSGINYQPVSEDILIQLLRTNAQERIGGYENHLETRLEDYIVKALMDFDDVSYDDDAELLYKLSGQMVAHLRSYLSEDDALGVVRYHGKQLARAIHAQMQAHRWERADRYEAQVSRGFETLRANNYTSAADEGVRDFRAPVEDRLYIRGMRFGGFSKCLYAEQKFDSDSERRMAVVIENDRETLKWFKPAPGQMRIFYRSGDVYKPDFVVETKTLKYLCEPKRASEMTDPDVVAKARTAVLWCRHATEHETANGGKPWTYLLIPHDAITAASTLAGLAATYAMTD